MSELTKKERHLATGETRQFDYRPIGERNPLFTRLGEKDRRCNMRLEHVSSSRAEQLVSRTRLS